MAILAKCVTLLKYCVYKKTVYVSVRTPVLHDLYILDGTAFLECMSDVCVYMCICYNLALLFHVLCVFENLLC